ncbi:AAA family ATPase [Thiomicrorhabdus sp.]|uniref:AAA family ATPase n=1 Tax=Thiomicrorhabdus sp. TaxID=2039724 RepID=UPI002AA90F7E|nr:AAA family ATPase [Thiomicrorhabdus sp.]
MTNLSASDVALKQALYFGHDEDLVETVRVSIVSKYSMNSMDEIPHIWPEEIDLVFLEYGGDSAETLSKINQILTLAKGVPLYILLQQKDADFIIEASHQGVQGFIECPNEVLHILSILHMQDRRRLGKNGNVSSLFSLKGGVGCTALATNLASHLNDMTEGRTVLVDLNMPLGDTALYLNMESQHLYSLTDFVYNLNRFDENLIYKSLSQHESGLYLLPLPTEVTELESLNGNMVKTIIQALRRYYDHVIIDCASDLSDMTISCLDESDNIVLVSEPSLSSLRAVNSVLQLTQKLGYVKDSIKLVVNRSNSDDDEMLNEVVNSLDVETVIKVNNAYADFNESLKEGILLKEYNPDSIINKQLHNIANMMHNGSKNMYVDQPIERSSIAKNWLNKLLKKESKPANVEQTSEEAVKLLNDKMVVS